ncbi:SIS domain-containing protein [Aquirufa echingensis]|uniref:SIS domain-containing protein n=1 Tax=Aquirufa echingensis TaxID=3096516 RepID=A0ABW6CZC5_9BACT
MKTPYYINFINSINEGLNKSQFFKMNSQVNGEYFFEEINELITGIRENRNKIYFFGNGASAAFANHMALDFSKNGKILSRSLSDSAFLTALSNDYSFEEAMVEYLKIEGVSENDLVITISSSGNSQNVLNVLEFCKNNNISTFSFSGLKETNKSISLSKYAVYVPMKTYGMVECIHQVFLHSILDESMQIFEWNRSGFQNMSSKEFNL